MGLGLALRLWGLSLKPLWLDEAITAVFVTGHRYDDMPIRQILPLDQLLAHLTWHPQSCGAIARAVQTQSTHPPLFFCSLHTWLGLFQDTTLPLRWQMRSLSVLFGVVSIGAIYRLAQQTFSQRAGLLAAALMAVSPFAVYLAQEARHYTLPMLVITLALLPFTALCNPQKQSWPRWQLWLAWMGLHSLGFYCHYFCLLAFVPQTIVLAAFAYRDRRLQDVALTGLAAVAVGLTLLPWLPILLGHLQRPETDWLDLANSGGGDWLGPILRLLAGWIVMVVFFPVEEQAIAVTLVSGLLMLGGVIYFIWQLRPRLTYLVQHSAQRSGARALGWFIGVTLLEYLILIYGLHKDLTLAFRYHFVYYPAVCALLGACLASTASIQPHNAQRMLPGVMLLVGLLSTGFVVNDAAFLKPFQPRTMALELLHDPVPNLTILKTFTGWQDVALGLSVALAVQQSEQAGYAPQSFIQWAFTPTIPPPPLKIPESGFPTPEVDLWEIGALHRSLVDAGEWQLQVHAPVPKPAPKVDSVSQTKILHCQPAGTVQKRMGVQYRRSFCQLKD